MNELLYFINKLMIPIKGKGVKVEVDWMGEIEICGAGI
jgi:hypothetical protein